jgi:hypothetical protein
MDCHSDFHQYLFENLPSPSSFPDLMGKFSSNKRFYYVMKNPDAATLEEVLLVAEALGEHPSDLMHRFVGLACSIPKKVVSFVFNHKGLLNRLESYQIDSQTSF